MDNNGEKPKRGNPNWGVKKRFGYGQAQPSNEAKKAGWERRKKNRALIQMLLNLQFHGNMQGDEALREKLRAYFNLSHEEMDNFTNETAIYATQIVKAIQKGDTQAAEMLMQRAYGKSMPSSLKDEEGDTPSLNIQIVYAGTSADDTPPIAEAEELGDDDVR